MWRRWPAKTLSELLLITFNTQQVVWNNIHFVMWDLGGQESLRTAWNTYYSNTEFIILVWLLATSTTTCIPILNSFFSKGDWQYRQRENICVKRGVAQNARERRAPQGVGSCICQQTRCRRVHDCHRDLATAQPTGMYCSAPSIQLDPCFSEPKKTSVADTGLLWAHRGRVSHQDLHLNLTHTCVFPGCTRG